MDTSYFENAKQLTVRILFSFDMTFLGGQSEKKPTKDFSIYCEFWYFWYLGVVIFKNLFTSLSLRKNELQLLYRSNFFLLFYSIFSNSSHPDKSIENFLKTNYISYTEMHVMLMNKL